MKPLFGTDGIRAEAGQFPLDSATINTIGFSLARHLGEKVERKPQIVIGRDTRESGSWIEQALTSGAIEGGAECHSAGVITTPGVAYLTRTLPADAGVVISASHNPFQDNGIKIFSPTGQKMAEAVEKQIEMDVFHSQTDPRSKVQHQPKESSPEFEADLSDRYLKFLTEEIGRGLSLSGLSLVVDCANGASSDLAPRLFQKLGAQVTAINCEPNGRNINLNCGSLHIEALQQQVINERVDLGVAFDGDADRSLFVDERGNYVDGDGALWVLAKNLQDHNQLKDNAVVATVMSNLGLEVALTSRGIKLIRTDVGDKYVLDELLRIKGSLGGEQSGHVIMPHLSLAGDGMITSLCLLRALTDSKESLSALMGGFEHYPQTLVNVRVREKVPFAELPMVQAAVAEAEERLAQTGRLLLRYSGTERLARVMIEGKNQEEIESYASQIASALRQEIGV
jgi:phosphoglucosamine mutase